MQPQDPLAIAQVNRRLKSIRRAFADAKVRSGWIRYMRQSLGMTLKKLGERASVSTGTIAQAERGEVAGKVTIATLKTMAKAMECEFVYAFVPKVDIDVILKQEARKKAQKILAAADTHMTLEDQRVSRDLKERIERLANKLIQRGEVW